MAEEAAAAATPQPQETPVRVSFGAYTADLLANNKTIGDIKAYVQNATDMPDNAQPFVNNRRVDANYVVQPNDTITFSRPSGDKG